MPICSILPAVLLLSGVAADWGDTLDKMPRYDRYQKMQREIGASIKSGALFVTWADDGKSFTYERDGKVWKYDVGSRKAEATDAKPQGRQRPGRGRRAPERGRQFETAFSPDEKMKAVSRDRNVFISTADGKDEVQVTTEGNETKRIKYGVASWVYGEELNVREAMWWSPDGKKLAFYRFDEGPVKDYFLAMEQRSIQDKLDVEAYPKAGQPNPKVEVLIYDLDTKQTAHVDGSFGDPSLAEYLYDVRWSPDGKELLFNRTNRKQNVMELCAADPVTGKCRAVAREEQLQSWAENHPDVLFLKDNNRFIWSSERTGYKNLTLRDMSGKELATLTRGKVDVRSVLKVDEERKVVYYTSSGEKNPYYVQLHRVGLNGKGDKVLTDESLAHQVTLSPDGRYFVDVVQNADTPAETRLLDDGGKVLDVVAKSDTSKFDELGLKKTEVFTYRAADGVTDLYGTLQFPSDFDPSKKYPLVVSVYAGPESGGIFPGFRAPDPITEMGFLVASFAGRGTSDRGKAFRDWVYGKLGVVEIDDQAAGVRALRERPYVDGKRVGIFGTSYGGYASLMAVLRYPDVFQCASCSSSVTDWRNYDSIYTERYQGLPDETENKKGYDAGSAMTYAKDLKGRVILYYGTADNNVHPANTLQFVEALERASKRYDMMVGPDRGHTSINSTRMWEFFVQNLVLHPSEDTLKTLLADRRKQAKASSTKS